MAEVDAYTREPRFAIIVTLPEVWRATEDSVRYWGDPLLRVTARHDAGLTRRDTWKGLGPVVRLALDRNAAAADRREAALRAAGWWRAAPVGQQGTLAL